MKRIPLKKALSAYFALRNAMGYQTDSGKPMLKHFVEYLNCNNAGTSIRAQLVIDWVCDSSSTHSTSTQKVRLSLARGFLRYLKANYPAVEIPSTKLIATVVRPMPYVLSTAEILQLLSAAEELKGRCLHGQTLKTLLGLMACTGLRPGEAIRLQLADVHLEEQPPCLLVRNSKFGKSRWVPIHVSTALILRNYLQWRLQLRHARSSEAFFVATKRNAISPLKYITLQQTFQDVIQRIGIVPQAGQLRPTLHSLRHTFAVHRLKCWYEDGANVRSLLPNLAVYLGHTCLSRTFWYLSSTPELMETAAERFESYAGRGGAL